MRSLKSLSSWTNHTAIGDTAPNVQCIRELLRIAVEDYSLPGVHGGCAKENIASARAMEKGGMVQYGTEENGDPLFRYRARNSIGYEGNS